MDPTRILNSTNVGANSISSISSTASSNSTSSSLPEYNASQVFFSLFTDEKGHNTYKNTAKCNRKMVLTFEKLSDYERNQKNQKVRRKASEVDDHDETIKEFQIPSIYRLSRENSDSEFPTNQPEDKVNDGDDLVSRDPFAKVHDVVIDMNALRSSSHLL